MKITLKAFLALFLIHQSAFGASNSVSSDVLTPNSTAFDITFTDDTTNKIYINKTYIEVAQVVKEIEKIANALVPRDITVASCSSTTGCPLDSVQCDAVTETPYCPDGSTLNTTRDMCQKDPDVFSCPTGFTYDMSLKQCVKPLDCPSGGTYSIERNRCEFKRIYECPTGYTQSGDTCIAPPTCPSGATFDSTILKCTVDPTFACADAGWTYDASTNKCFYAPPTCPTGYSYNKQYDVCLLNYTVSCPSGYSLNSTRNRCEKTPPDCPSGTTYNSTTNRCEQGSGSACTLSGGTWNGSKCTIETKTVKKNLGFWYASSDNCYGKSDGLYATTTGQLVNGNEVVITTQVLDQCVGRGVDVSYSANGCAQTDPDTGECLNSGMFFYQISGVYSSWAGKVLFNKNTCQITWAYQNSYMWAPSTNTISDACDITITNVAPSCPTGYTHDGSGKCYANPTCPSSGSFDGDNDVCHLPFTKECPTNGTYDSSVDQCIADATCTKGSLNKTLDRCEQDYQPVCGTGWTFNTTSNMCEKDPFCVVGTYSTTYDKCLLAYTPTCATGYTYNSTRSRCEKTPPDCPSGTTYNATTNRCEQGAGSACTLSGGTWNGTSCTVGSNYAATTNNKYTTCSGAGFINVYGTAGGSAYTVGSGAPTGCGWGTGCEYICIATTTLPQETTNTRYGSFTNTSTPTTTYTCPSGGTLSGTTCINQTTVAPSCPTGYTHDGSGKCYANPTCPSSGSFDGNLDMCWLAFGKSCTTGTYDTTSNACVNEPICDGGTLNTTLDKCQISREIVCAQGVKDLTTGKCTFTATCQTGATLNAKGCNEEPIPLVCPSGTDTTLDVCYSDVNACKVDSTYPKVSTLTYSDALNICIVDENVVCASSLTWSELYQKCEAVPICYNGMYNPENDFCYISTKACPINAAYPCKGPIGNQWCSPYECNPTTNQCGYAECPGGIQPSLTAEMNPKYNANLVYNATDTLCTDAYCNLANSSRFTYCGLEASCPSGFGVFEQNGQCFVRECPQDSFQENNKCYSLGCPKGTTEQGSGKCLVN